VRHRSAGTPKEDALQALAVKDTGTGRPEALEVVFVEHQARVFRAAYRITGNTADAEDVVQTVFLRLARRGDDRPPVANLASYLYRSAINAALTMLRDRPERAVALEDVEPALGRSVPTPERLRESAEIAGWLREALARLDPLAAEMFALRYLEDQDNAEIARVLAVSRVRVAVTLHRTRRRLEKEFRAITGGRS
jgi:RNA polymerase sigma-70 factor (ECF subfamily)